MQTAEHGQQGRRSTVKATAGHKMEPQGTFGARVGPLVISLLLLVLIASNNCTLARPAFTLLLSVSLHGGVAVETEVQRHVPNSRP